MKNLLSLIGLAVVLVAGVGWYLGWYKIASSPTASGHREINVDVNTQKIRDDLKKGEKKVEGFLHQGTQGSTSNAPINVTPNVTPMNPTGGKSIEVAPTGFHSNPDGTFTIVPPNIEIK